MMKKCMLAFVAFLFSFSLMGQGIEFRNGSYEEVLKMAAKEKKLVFIDVYTSWCGPCRHMAKEIFTKAEAGEFFNPRFVCIKVDAEKSEDGKRIAAEFGVSAYPTCLFVDQEGKLVYRFLGGRTVQKLMEEGRKAKDAYEARPLLEEYGKKYEKGNRSLNFLEAYYELLDKSGMDCSGILADYFAQIDDAALLDSVQLPRIARMGVYDEVFAARLVGVFCKNAARLKEDRMRFAAVNKAVCSYLSAVLRYTSRQGLDSGFEAVLALKDKVFEAAGNHDSVTSASLGGMQIYVPSSLSRLEYYAARGKKGLFMDTFRKYMEENEEKFRKEQPSRLAMEKELELKLEETRKKGNEKEYEELKRMSSMMTAFSTIDDSYISSNMIGYVGKFDGFYAGEKDEGYREQLRDWYVFLHRMSPSVKTAAPVAGKLLEAGWRKEAAEVLELALKEGRKAPGAEESDAAACESMLEKLLDK